MNKHLGLIFILFIAICICYNPYSLAANKIDKSNAGKFLEQYKIVINSGREDSLNNFFKFYSAYQAKYIVTSYYVDPNKNEELISQEQREMNRDQFIKFILSSFELASNYQYIQNIENIAVDDLNDSATVQFNYNENILLTSTSNGGLPQKFYQKVFANCNMNLVVETADISISGLNCIRKIAKRNFN